MLYTDSSIAFGGYELGEVSQMYLVKLLFVGNTSPTYYTKSLMQDRVVKLKRAGFPCAKSEKIVADWPGQES